MVYDRIHTREISAYGGLVNNMPKYAVAFMVFTMANVGLPGTSGFVGEFLTLLGAFRANTWVAFFATTGVILSACLCALALSPGDFRGTRQGKSQDRCLIFQAAKRLILYPLIALTIFFGVYPAPVFDATAASVDALVNNYSAALQAAQDVALSVK